MGPMYVINALTDMKSCRAFMAPALVAEKKGTMYGVTLLLALIVTGINNWYEQRKT